MLDYRIGFVDRQEFDDEVPAVFSIVTTWGWSQRLLYKNVRSGCLRTLNPLLGLFEVVAW